MKNWKEQYEYGLSFYYLLQYLHNNGAFVVRRHQKYYEAELPTMILYEWHYIIIYTGGSGWMCIFVGPRSLYKKSERDTS